MALDAAAERTDNQMMLAEMFEIAATVTKCMQELQRLGNIVSGQIPGSKVATLNQIGRWVRVKDEHCDRLIQLISTKCLCEKVARYRGSDEDSDGGDRYRSSLVAHHELMQKAMLVKQSIKLDDCSSLTRQIEVVGTFYDTGATRL